MKFVKSIRVAGDGFAWEHKVELNGEKLAFESRNPFFDVAVYRYGKVVKKHRFVIANLQHISWEP